MPTSTLFLVDTAFPAILSRAKIPVSLPIRPFTGLARPVILGAGVFSHGINCLAQLAVGTCPQLQTPLQLRASKMATSSSSSPPGQLAKGVPVSTTAAAQAY